MISLERRTSTRRGAAASTPTTQVEDVDGDAAFTFGAGDERALVPTRIAVRRIHDVSLHDSRQPDVVRFKTRSALRRCGCRRNKKLVFRCAEPRDAELLVGVRVVPNVTLTSSCF